MDFTKCPLEDPPSPVIFRKVFAFLLKEKITQKKHMCKGV